MSVFLKNLAGDTNLLDQQELEANRRGEITETQKQRLNALLGWGQVSIMVIAVLVMGAVLAILSFSLVFNARLEGSILFLLLVFGGGFLIFLLFTGRSLWKLWNTATKLRRDQANRAIRQSQGQLSYSKKGYVVQANDRNIMLPMNDTGGLLPGVTYRMYYLEESGFLLSAEESYAANPAQVRVAINEILAGANGFSLEDLAANRNGLATPAQHRKSIPNAISGVVIGLAALLCLIPIFLWVASPSNKNTLPILFLTIITAIFLLVGGFMVVNALIDMSVSTPQQVQGAGHKEKRVSGGQHPSTHYYYVVGGQSFEVGYGAYTALIDSLEYQVYYLPRTKRLIAIEALDTSPGNPSFPPLYPTGII